MRSDIRDYFKPLTVCRRTKIVTVRRVPPNISECICATCNRQRLDRCEFGFRASFRSDPAEYVILERPRARYFYCNRDNLPLIVWPLTFDQLGNSGCDFPLLII